MGPPARYGHYLTVQSTMANNSCLPIVLGFVVCLLLYAVLLLQDVFACTVHVAHVYMCVGHGTDPQIGLGQ